MIIKNNSDSKIENFKSNLGLVGDVYIVGHFIESLESHKLLIPDSTATTLEEAETERITYEAEQERLRQILAEQARLEELTKEQNGEFETNFAEQ